jgi:hypothetical protein
LIGEKDIGYRKNPLASNQKSVRLAEERLEKPSYKHTALEFLFAAHTFSAFSV